ncbi:MAG: CBS domain-containing protein [Kiloniellales bacterium]|nr:CBS domain-containing protein [Kiloniellales bacterium]
MQVSDILESKGDRVVAMHPEASVCDVAGTLKQEGIGAVLVRGRDGKMLGIVSERDIVREVAEEGAGALSKSAADLMSRSVVTCRPDSSTQELMEKMLAERIRHLPVYEGDELVGIVSIVDVVKGVLGDLKWRQEMLQKQVVKAVGWSTEED